MMVTVVSMSGLVRSAPKFARSTHVKMRSHIAETTVGKVTETCIRSTLELPLNDVIRANCRTGIFTDFSGSRHQFLGLNRNRDSMAKYAIRDLRTGEIANGSSASSYGTNGGIYSALCPLTAPYDLAH